MIEGLIYFIDKYDICINPISDDEKIYSYIMEMSNVRVKRKTRQIHSLHSIPTTITFYQNIFVQYTGEIPYIYINLFINIAIMDVIIDV